MNKKSCKITAFLILWFMSDKEIGANSDWTDASMFKKNKTKQNNSLFSFTRYCHMYEHLILALVLLQGHKQTVQNLQCFMFYSN